MWSDMNKHERRDFVEIAVAWVIGAICLFGSLAVIDRVGAPQDPPYEPPCRTAGHAEVPCE